MNIALNIVHIFDRFNVVVAGRKYSKDHNNEPVVKYALMKTVNGEKCYGKYLYYCLLMSTHIL